MNIDNIWDDDQKLIPAIIQDKFTKMFSCLVI